jgi:hypothetical protein
VDTGIAASLPGFSVADIDSTSLTLTLEAVNGTIGGLTDADPNRAGIQLIGNPGDINFALGAASFTATTSGAASINLSLSDGYPEVAKAVYALSASKANSAPSLSTNPAPYSTRLVTTNVANNVANSLSYLSVADPDVGQILTLTLTPTGGSFRNLADADSVAPGLQLSGSVTAINAALAAGSFVASANGAASIAASLSDGIAAAATATYTYTASNARPLTNAFSFLSGAKEDLTFTITSADLLEASTASDPGGSVVGFVVTSVDAAKGSLSINGSAWDATNNKLIDADHKAVWTPLASSNGTISNAFSVQALDNEGATSVNTIGVSIAVEAMNDAPTYSGIPSSSQAVSTGLAANLTAFTVADIDSPASSSPWRR